jgi:uncharacterized protein YkwD
LAVAGAALGVLLAAAPHKTDGQAALIGAARIADAKLLHAAHEHSVLGSRTQAGSGIGEALTHTPPATPAPGPPAKSQSSTPAAPVTNAPAPGGSGDYASAAACPGQDDLAATQTVLVCLTSYARAQHGAGGVASNSALMAAAAAKAQDIINCGFSHTACGYPFDYWMKAKGYGGNCRAENIAEGQKTPITVFTAWMNSAGHRANILNPSYNSIGVAGASSPAGVVWVMELGGC